ncbi:hypothetical protein V2G26_004075 [Clonostachys chloroleuca]
MTQILERKVWISRWTTFPRLTYRVNRMNIARTIPKNHHGSITSRISHHSTDHRGHKGLFQHLRLKNPLIWT